MKDKTLLIYFLDSGNILLKRKKKAHDYHSRRFCKGERAPDLHGRRQHKGFVVAELSWGPFTQALKLASAESV